MPVVDQIMFAFFVVLLIVAGVTLFFTFKGIIFSHDNFVMKPEQPPIKWMVDVVPCSINTKSGVEEYVVKRLDPKQNFVHYEIIAFFKTVEEAEAFVAEHFHFPMGYRNRPLPISEPEQES